MLIKIGALRSGLSLVMSIDQRKIYTCKYERFFKKEY